MPFAPSRRARIHYTVTGPEDAHDAVLLIQGLGLSSRFWFDIPEALATDPERRRRVLTIDNRGVGKSDRPRGLWTMRTMAEDAAKVLEHAGVGPAIVVGISMGGMIAQQLALLHPDKVKGLLLLATSPGFGTALPEPAALGRLLSLPFGGRRASRNLARLLLPESKWSRAKEIFKDWPSAMKEDSPSMATFTAHLLAATTHYAKRHLARIACPVIVVAGAEDSLIPLKNARVLANLIPGAQLEIVPDTGHAIFAEDRDIVRRMVRRLERG